MHKLLRHIPNSITCLNLISGTFSVIFAIDGHLTLAGLFIGLAAVFDFLDGVAARLLKAYSETGKELDSLADMVSFGLAPGLIVFTLLEQSIFGINQPFLQISTSGLNWVLLFSAFLIPVMSALRLARFNVKQSDVDYFSGLPTPANGMFWASMGMLLEANEYKDLLNSIFTTPVLVLLTIVFSGMLVINLPMFSLKIKNLRLQDNWYRYLFMVLVIVFFVAFNIYGLAAAIILYILMNLIFYFAGFKF